MASTPAPSIVPPSPAVVPPPSPLIVDTRPSVEAPRPPVDIAIQSAARSATAAPPTASGGAAMAPVRPKPGDRQHRILFDGFLYDYLYKSGYARAAAALLADAPETPVQPRTPTAATFAMSSSAIGTPSGSTSPPGSDVNTSPILEGKEGSASSPDTPIETLMPSSSAGDKTIRAPVTPSLASLPKPKVRFDAPQAWLYEWHTAFFDVFRSNSETQTDAARIYQQHIKNPAPVRRATAPPREHTVYPPHYSTAAPPVARAPSQQYSQTVYANTQAQMQQRIARAPAQPTPPAGVSNMQHHPTQATAAAWNQAQLQAQNQRAASIAATGDPSSIVADAQQAHNEQLALRRQRDAYARQQAQLYAQDPQRRASGPARQQSGPSDQASYLYGTQQGQLEYQRLQHMQQIQQQQAAANAAAAAHRIQGPAGSPLNPHARLPAQQPINVADPQRFRPSANQPRARASMNAASTPQYEQMIAVPPTSAHARRVASPAPMNASSPYVDPPTPSAGRRSSGAGVRRKRDDSILVGGVDDHQPAAKRATPNQRRSGSVGPPVMLSNEPSIAMPPAYPPSMMIPRATQAVPPPQAQQQQQQQQPTFDALFDHFTGSTSGGDGSLEALLGYQPSSLSASNKPAEDDLLAQFLNDDGAGGSIGDFDFAALLNA